MKRFGSLGQDAQPSGVHYAGCAPARLFRSLSFGLASLMLGSFAGSARAEEPARPASSALIPVRTFFRHADLDAVKLSPSGRWLAAATGAATGRVKLAVIDLQGTVQPIVVAAFAEADIGSFDWVNDDRLVFNLVDLQVGFGNQGFGPGLYSVRRDASELRRLIRARRDFMQEAARSVVQPLEWNHELLSVPTTPGDDVIVGRYTINGKGDVESVLPLRLNVATGRTTSVANGAPDHAFGWLFSPTGEPRAAVSRFQGHSELFWREGAGAPWRSLAKFPSYAAPMAPAFVDGAGQLFVTTPSPAGTSVLRRFDFTSNRPEPEALVRTAGFDFRGQLVADPGSSTSQTLGMRVWTDAESTVWFDDQMKELQRKADAQFPGRVNRLFCRRCTSDGMLLVLSYSDQDPGRYWIYRPAQDAWESVGKVRNDVDPAQMAQLDLHRIWARDGQDLPVWVTTPHIKAPAAAPAVVLVHGGPWVRGTHWRWNAEAQFLASRGYVVIEPEYRGSTGFGRSHFESGWKQWGGTMQDDVADAVRWAAATGRIDPKRVCIAGGSYGGYATLMGLIRYPDLYRCGVAWVAVTDPRLRYDESWASDSTPEVREFALPVLVGDPNNDAEMLKAATPLERAAEIRAPLLLAFGAQDRRVPLEHGTRMRQALEAAGRKPEWVVYGDEGHGWGKVDNMVDFWQRAERLIGSATR